MQHGNRDRARRDLLGHSGVALECARTTADRTWSSQIDEQMRDRNRERETLRTRTNHAIHAPLAPPREGEEHSPCNYSLSLFQLLYAIRNIVVFHHGRQKGKGTQVWRVSQSSVIMTDAKAGTIICWIFDSSCNDWQSARPRTKMMQIVACHH